MKFLIADGEMVEVKEINLNQLITEPSFQLSQKVWYGYGGIPLFKENLLQLKIQAERLRINYPDEFDNHGELFRLTKRMLNKNKFYRSGYIHFQLFYSSGEVHFLISCNATRFFDFPYSENGVLATLSAQQKQSKNSWNRFPFYNKMIWQAGRAEIHQSLYQQVIFLNESHSVCEGVHANIFLIKANELITPDLSGGCYEDLLRAHILEASKEAGLKVTEMSRIDEAMIYEMDEIFLASESSGIQWVLGINNKRYLRQFSESIHERINFIFKKKAAF
ncbi:MAG: aminotransferase class IV [Mariniphaga sp.]|nr:aminotransferase class IV [Mariniphaga sp.]